MLLNLLLILVGSILTFKLISVINKNVKENIKNIIKKVFNTIKNFNHKLFIKVKNSFSKLRSLPRFLINYVKEKRQIRKQQEEQEDRLAYDEYLSSSEEERETKKHKGLFSRLFKNKKHNQEDFDVPLNEDDELEDDYSSDCESNEDNEPIEDNNAYNDIKINSVNIDGVYRLHRYEIIQDSVTNGVYGYKKDAIRQDDLSVAGEEYNKVFEKTIKL